MTSSIYFTATRNIRANDVIRAFEKHLKLGKICENDINIVPVLKKEYNHVFLNITWNETFEAAKFVSELISKSNIKIYHNKGFWLCRLNRNPLKFRRGSKCVKFSSISNPCSVEVTEAAAAEIEVEVSESNNFCEDDFYVIN